MTTVRRTLVVRLRNWVGDATLGVPLLRRLDESGYELQLVGKGWAVDLLAGHGWPVHVLPRTFGERVRLLRRLRHDAQVRDAGFDRRLNALCLPYSFSSALEFRLAGLRALGHAHEGRNLLLARAVPRPRDRHELAVYWELADALTGMPAPLPERIGLAVTEADRARARALADAQGIVPGYIAICPFAGGTFDKLDKTWPAFAEFVAGPLRSLGRTIVVCPGPGEEEEARARYAGAVCLSGVRLGVYAALLADAALMISNDTGPGHLAAAVGTPLVSVLGPTDAARWGAWGPGIQRLGGSGRWPATEQVLDAVRAALKAR